MYPPFSERYEDDSERPTIPSPPDSTEIRCGKEYLVTPTCTYPGGCSQPRRSPGHTRCKSHSDSAIPSARKCSRCRRMFAPQKGDVSPMCNECRSRKETRNETQ